MEPEPFVFQQDGILLALRAAAPPTTEKDQQELLEAVSRYALRPLAQEEFAVFCMDLCNNQVDRHFSRFPEEELEKISALVPGRPLMERHDMRGSLPRGRFFRSALHRDGDHVSVRPEVYVLRTRENADFILNIEGGVYLETSIGFSFRMPECSICGKDLRTCDHVPGRRYGEDQCHFIMHDVVEVIEGSVVASGSQGTGFVASERVQQIQPVLAALETAREAYHRPIELFSRTPWAAE